MRFDILSLFPAMFEAPFRESILGRAADRGRVEIAAHYLRDWAEGRHQVTDDTPYGGGEGMVMKPEPVVRAMEDLRSRAPGSPVLLLTPQGKLFTRQIARDLAGKPGLILVCGRYEGFDERIRGWVDGEYSIGDYVLTGGEFAAMVIIDAVARLVPGVLGSSGSAEDDSFEDGLLEYPQYTRPAEFRGERVPEVLLSGHHGEIVRWRRRQQLLRTLIRRPDLLQRAPLSDRDRELLEELGQEMNESPKSHRE